MDDHLNPYAPPLAELEQEHPEWLVTQPLARDGKRFLNYLIDMLVFPFTVPMVSFLLPDSDSYLFNLGRNYLVYVIYAFVNESCGGQGISKLMTGTQARMRDGSPLTMKAAFLRSLCRLIPFEQFSFLGSPGEGWHDSITGTKVIDLRARPERRRKYVPGAPRPFLPPGVILPGAAAPPAGVRPPVPASPSPGTKRPI